MALMYEEGPGAVEHRPAEGGTSDADNVRDDSLRTVLPIPGLAVGVQAPYRHTSLDLPPPPITALAALRQNSPRSTQPVRSASQQLIVRRKIVVNGAKVTRHTLAGNLDFNGNLTAQRLLMPIAQEWLTSPGSERDFGSFAALRSGLVAALCEHWVDQTAKQLPMLRKFLPIAQFRTLAVIANLASDFDGQRLERALTAVTSSKLVVQASVAHALSTEKLPAIDAAFDIFSSPCNDWARGLVGVCAELETAAQVDPSFVQPGQKVRLSQNFDFGGEIGGVSTQDADVSFVDISGVKVLVEVAATIPRLRVKMGADGAAQRKRYERVRRHQTMALAYSTSGDDWIQYFSGDLDTSIAERLPLLDNGWGLIIDGQYVSPQRLLEVAGVIRGAEPSVAGFWEAMNAAGLRFGEVESLSAPALAKRLQRNARH